MKTKKGCNLAKELQTALALLIVSLYLFISSGFIKILAVELAYMFRKANSWIKSFLSLNKSEQRGYTSLIAAHYFTYCL